MKSCIKLTNPSGQSVTLDEGSAEEMGYMLHWYEAHRDFFNGTFAIETEEDNDMTADIIITDNHEITLIEEDNHMNETTTTTPAFFEGIIPTFIGNGLNSDPLNSYELVTAMTGEVEGRLEAFKSDFSHDLFRVAELTDETSPRGSVAWWMVRRLGTYFMHNLNPADNLEELEDLRGRYEERAVYRITRINGGFTLEKFEDTFKETPEPEEQSVMIIEYAGRYLVKTPRGYQHYVVCSNWDETKPEGERWSNGHYFYDKENALRYLLGIGKISPSRLEEIATHALTALTDDIDSEEAWDYLKERLEDLDLEDDELEFFGYEKPRRYRVVNVEVTRTMVYNVQVVIEEDDPDYRAGEELDNADLEDLSPDSDDWEYDYLDDAYNNLSEDKVDELRNDGVIDLVNYI